MRANGSLSHQPQPALSCMPSMKNPWGVLTFSFLLISLSVALVVLRGKGKAKINWLCLSLTLAPPNVFLPAFCHSQWAQDTIATASFLNPHDMALTCRLKASLTPGCFSLCPQQQSKCPTPLVMPIFNHSWKTLAIIKHAESLNCKTLLNPSASARE